MATIQITVNPKSFGQDGEEAARVIREIADKIENGRRRFRVMDCQGNSAAKVRAEDIPGGRGARGR